MDKEVEAKRKELFKVLLEIEGKMNRLDAKGLSLQIFDFDKIKTNLEEMQKTCKNESALSRHS
jgi:cytochrome c556